MYVLSVSCELANPPRVVAFAFLGIKFSRLLRISSDGGRRNKEVFAPRCSADHGCTRAQASVKCLAATLRRMKTWISEKGKQPLEKTNARRSCHQRLLGNSRNYEEKEAILRIGGIICFQPSKLWKAKFSKWKGYWHTQCLVLTCFPSSDSQFPVQDKQNTAMNVQLFLHS